MKFPMWCRAILFAGLSFSISADEEPFSFVVMSDIHAFTPLSFTPFDNSATVWIEGERILKNIKNNYGGGEFVVMPGDSSSYGSYSNAKIASELGGNLPHYDAIYKAGVNCHSSTKELFNSAGFDALLPTVGDHELGGNDGFQVAKKLSTVPAYRQAYVDGFFRDGQQSGPYLFNTPVAGAPARPVGTMFEGSSFAYRFRNVVIISVDAFRLVGNGDANYFDREQGFGGEGAITCDVSGDHLAWFENVLKSARLDSTIKHIFVEAHLPIIQPVRKVNCSGQFMDGADKSEFWKLMNQYQVDIYFAGEVHSNTVSKTKEPNSSLIQIVSRSNRFGGFMTVGITDDQIHVKHYNEKGDKWRFNNQYVKDGSLHISKSSGEIKIECRGELELLDDSVALIRFDFEEITPLGTRQVLGFYGDKTALMANSIDIDDVTCIDGLENQGSFGKQYDAQIGNVQLVEGRPGGGRSARFTDDSRLAIFAMGPLSGGQVVSVSLWFKTSHTEKDMVLVYYGQPWGPSKKKDQLAITLRNGIPTFHISRDQAYTVTGISSIADMNWHHLVLTMPKQSCLSSEIQLYIDGYRASLETMMPSSPDNHVFFSTQGRMSFGGFGYSSKATRKIYKDMVPYMGELDEVTVWSRTLSIEEIIILASTNTASPEPISSPSPSPTDSNPKSDEPSVLSSDEPSVFSSDEPSVLPSDEPSVLPFDEPSTRPTIDLTSQTPDSSLPTNTVSESPSNLSSSPTQSPVFTCNGKNCTDDETFEFTLKNGNVRKCAWIGKRNTAKRSSMYCVFEEVKSACQKSCGVIDSCQDDPDFTFSLRNGNTQNCFWFNKNEKKATARKYGYCYEDDKLTRTALAGSCARSCGLCADD